MVQPVRAELLTLIQASLGWAVLAVRAARPNRTAEVAPGPVARTPGGVETPVRLRATITIDIDACDADEADRRSDMIREQFGVLKRAHPMAELAFQRRRPRTGPRSPTPSLVVAPYADD
jgi:hypothetical protein